MRAILLILAALAFAAGCTEPTGPKTVYNPNPSIKIPAIKQAVADHDLSAAPELVKNLDSDDPAVRFYAIQGLRRLTGEDFGYRYYDERDQRRPAVLKWRNWLKEH